MAEEDGFLIEFCQVGDSLKVSAIDPRSGAEVSIVGSPKATQSELSRLAIRKLLYVLEKEGETKGPDSPSSSGPRKGIVI